MIWCEKSVHFGCGMTFIRSCSILTASSFFVVQPPGNAMHMRIDDNADVLAEPAAQHDIRGFPRCSGNGQQLLHSIRNLAAEFVDDLLAAPTINFLIAEEISRTDVRLQLLGYRAAKCCWVGYFVKITGVTMFTRTSVHWAERIVATRISHALL